MATAKPIETNNIPVIMGALMLTLLLAALDQTIVSTALPRIVSELHGLSEYAWVATAYLLTSAISTPLYGKISDMFGRKKIFMVSIGIFLFGSMLCGLSQNMTELIIFRGIQGLGAGGLMTLVLSIIGDVIPPRKRGKYQGLFGGVFALSSVAGPLIGGLITDHFSWRWVFYINMPIGALALFVIMTKLHLPVRKAEHKLDYAGAGLLAVSGISLLLGTEWGGDKYAWLSGQIIGLFATALIGALLFVWREKRAAEPIIPLHLFRDRTFSVSTLLSLLVGIVMFGALVFLPQYQQIIRGDSATKSGLMLLPLVGGLLIASVISGRLISRFGRYRHFPIIGSTLLVISFWLFSHITATTDRVMIGIWMAILGLGIGQIMPVLTLAVQNAVDRKDLGTATSSVTFFRSIGSSLGAAIFGAVLTNRLTYHITENIPGSTGDNIAAGLQHTANNLQQLPPDSLQLVLQSFGQAFSDIFKLGIPFAAVTLLVALLLKEAPLRDNSEPVATD